MRLISWMLFGAIALLATTRPTMANTIRGRWLGQDRHDYCGEVGSTVAPNGVQDIHVAVFGLPPRRKIVKVTINGHGADEWRYGDQKNQFAAVMFRKPNATTADLFFEPFHAETGREFSIKIKFDNNEVVEFYVKGGKADPTVRMQDAAMHAQWIGQTRDDYAGLGPSVGPDGFQDASIALTKLSRNDRVKSILIESTTTRWTFGLNPEGNHNAELVLSEKDPTQGRLYFQPETDLAGRKLALTLQYESGKGDRAIVMAGRVEPRLAVPTSALPKWVELPIQGRWFGQDGHDVVGRGDVHIQLFGIPRNKVVAAAVLGDSVRKTWVYRSETNLAFESEEGALPMAYRPSPDRTQADLYFPPYRNEAGNTLTLRLIFLDGDVAFIRIAAKECDPAKRAPSVAAKEVTARPGDDLNRLANTYGTVRIAKGNYRLNAPLVLKNPVKILGEPGVTLEFSQDASQSPWTTVIKFHSGGTTLEGFAIRFATPIRWRKEVSWGPAVIGSTDSFDTEGAGPKAHVAFVNLDIETPSQVVKPGTWEEVPKLFRLVDVEGGTIAGNKLRGGVTEFFGGPWKMENNEHRGTPPGTFTPTIFAGHDTFDLVLRGNRAKPDGPSGKTWRFLVLTNNGHGDLVEGNTIEGVGPRDDDAIPSANAPEIILTESYQIRFEGKPAAISADGKLVKLPRLRSEPPRTGDVVSVVAGKGAGAVRRVAQRIEADVVLLDAPLPNGADALVVSPGFVNEVFDKNVIDAQGGTEAAGFILAGNHFNTKLVHNTIRGAGDAFQLTAFPTESPGIWGWSHAPFMNVLVEGNLWEDSARGGTIGVMHSKHTKTTRGRLYLTATLVDNTISWTKEFLAKQRASSASQPLVGLTLGFEGSVDPAESRIAESKTTSKHPNASAKLLRVHSTILNGKAVRNEVSRNPDEAKPPKSAERYRSAGSPRR